MEELPEPTLNSNSVIIQVLATGICRSDWHGWMGHDPDIRLPHVPGHELVGVVVELGSGVKKFTKGDRVTVPFVCGCGSCRECLSGNHQVCDNQSQPGFTHWGSFAEYVRIDHADINLVRLPESISDIAAASLGCRFITSFRAIRDQAKVEPGQAVAVFGCGGVGLAAIMIAKALGASVIGVDINDEALEYANAVGADTLLNVRNVDDVPAAVKALTSGGVEVTVDALGSESTSTQSISSLKKRGKHIQVGLMTGNHANLSIPMDRIVAHELEIIGSHGMQAFRYDEIFEMIDRGLLDLDKLISRTVNLEEGAVVLRNMNKMEHSGVTVIDSF